MEEIHPAVQTNSIQLGLHLSKGQQFFSELYQIFGNQQDSLIVIYSVSASFYKIMLAFQLMTKEQVHSFRSMAHLKTKPSLQSNKSFREGRRSYQNHRKSAKISILPIMKPNYKYSLKQISKNCQIFTPFIKNDPYLLKVHAQNGGIESRLLLLKSKQNEGDKIIQCTRQTIWIDSISHIDNKFPNANIKIKFKGQIGIDYGGITRQWITLIVKQLINPDLGLFQLSVNKLSFQPSKNSWLVPNHLIYFQKFGILVGKAMKQNWLLEINFTKSFLKHLLGRTLYVQDLQDIDPDTSRSLLWILSNQINQDLGITFSYQSKFMNNKILIQLIPNGNNIYVNQDNKKQYVKKLAIAKMTQQIRQQSKSFMNGLQKVISFDILKLFTHQELGIYLAGMPKIDIHQMKKYSKYQNYQLNDNTIIWFWETLSSWDQNKKAKFLFYLTGSYKVPYGGFKLHPIIINKMNGCLNYLPVSHTCFSIIDLPEYTTQQKLAKQLQKAIEEGKGFSVS